MADKMTVRRLSAFFGTEHYLRFTCANSQLVDREGLKGRMLSSSYCPKPGHPQHELLMKALNGLFDRFQSNGSVRFDYLTQAYAAQPGGPA